jgi:hypothetical protein
MMSTPPAGYAFNAAWIFSLMVSGVNGLTT